MTSQTFGQLLSRSLCPRKTPSYQSFRQAFFKGLCTSQWQAKLSVSYYLAHSARERLPLIIVFARSFSKGCVPHNGIKNFRSAIISVTLPEKDSLLSKFSPGLFQKAAYPRVPPRTPASPTVPTVPRRLSALFYKIILTVEMRCDIMECILSGRLLKPRSERRRRRCLPDIPN